MLRTFGPKRYFGRSPRIDTARHLRFAPLTLSHLAEGVARSERTAGAAISYHPGEW